MSSSSQHGHGWNRDNYSVATAVLAQSRIKEKKSPLRARCVFRSNIELPLLEVKLLFPKHLVAWRLAEMYTNTNIWRPNADSRHKFSAAGIITRGSAHSNRISGLSCPLRGIRDIQTALPAYHRRFGGLSAPTPSLERR